MARSKNHIYEGFIEAEKYRLFTDGEEEWSPWLWDWGWKYRIAERGDIHPFSIDTATRILSREIPVGAIGNYIARFDEEVVSGLAINQPWRLTSEEIREWMERR